MLTQKSSNADTIQLFFLYLDKEDGAAIAGLVVVDHCSRRASDTE